MTEAVEGATQLSPETLEQLLLQMWQIRFFEARAGELFDERLIHGPVHSYIGHGSDRGRGGSSLRGSDDGSEQPPRSRALHREGRDVARMMAKILGPGDGYCRGKVAAMHIRPIANGILGRERDRRRPSQWRSGRARPSSQGEGRGSRSPSSVRCREPGDPPRVVQPRGRIDAAMVFVCENNQWAISTPITAVTRVDDIGGAGRRVRLPRCGGGRQRRARRARPLLPRPSARARSGSGPTLIEAKGCRGLEPHSAAREGRQQGARGARRVARGGGSDPPLHAVPRRRGGNLDGAHRRAVEAEARQSVADSVEVALASPRPSPGAELDDVYAPAAWFTPGRLS